MLHELLADRSQGAFVERLDSLAVEFEAAVHEVHGPVHSGGEARGELGERRQPASERSTEPHAHHTTQLVAPLVRLVFRRRRLPRRCVRVWVRIPRLKERVQKHCLADHHSNHVAFVAHLCLLRVYGLCAISLMTLLSKAAKAEGAE